MQSFNQNGANYAKIPSVLRVYHGITAGICWSCCLLCRPSFGDYFNCRLITQGHGITLGIAENCLCLATLLYSAFVLVQPDIQICVVSSLPSCGFTRILSTIVTNLVGFDKLVLVWKLMVLVRCVLPLQYILINTQAKGLCFNAACPSDLFCASTQWPRTSPGMGQLGLLTIRLPLGESAQVVHAANICPAKEGMRATAFLTSHYKK